MARKAKEETEAVNAFVRIEEAKQAIRQGVYSYDGRKWKNAAELVTLIKDQAAAMLDNVQRYSPQVVPEDVEQMTEYAPAKIIISRDSFRDDTAMANAHYILRDHGIELKLV